MGKQKPTSSTGATKTSKTAKQQQDSLERLKGLRFPDGRVGHPLDSYPGEWSPPSDYVHEEDEEDDVDTTQALPQKLPVKKPSPDEKPSPPPEKPSPGDGKNPSPKFPEKPSPSDGKNPSQKFPAKPSPIGREKPSPSGSKKPSPSEDNNSAPEVYSKYEESEVSNDDDYDYRRGLRASNDDDYDYYRRGYKTDGALLTTIQPPSRIHRMAEISHRWIEDTRSYLLSTCPDDTSVNRVRSLFEAHTWETLTTLIRERDVFDFLTAVENRYLTNRTSTMSPLVDMTDIFSKETAIADQVLSDIRSAHRADTLASAGNTPVDPKRRVRPTGLG